MPLSMMLLAISTFPGPKSDGKKNGRLQRYSKFWDKKFFSPLSPTIKVCSKYKPLRSTKSSDFSKLKQKQTERKRNQNFQCHTFYKTFQKFLQFFLFRWRSHDLLFSQQMMEPFFAIPYLGQETSKK